VTEAGERGRVSAPSPPGADATGLVNNQTGLARLKETHCMIRANPAPTRRAGFTLIELLVVIAIIAILVSLTAAAVFKISGKGDELIARHDISNLAAAIEAFKQQMKVDFIPSRFRLREDLFGYIAGITSNPPDQLDVESWAYLKKLFPKIPTPTAAVPNAGSVSLDWNNNGNVDQPVDLEGHQCLVFFLGGIPNYSPNNVTGFSTNPAKPSAAGGERIGPFYRDFKSDRLTIIATPPLSSNISVANSSYFSYLDPWGVNPYAYFSAYKKVNGYNRYLPYYNSLNPAVNTSDCTTLTIEDRMTLSVGTGAVWPYAQSVPGVANLLPTYLNKDTYQIISAGPDKVFGQGTPFAISKQGVWQTGQIINGAFVSYPNSIWSPQFASNQTPKGRDDFSNFHDRQLGSGD
jgi:prepilin-type N-terminal cleavage/methylation domain-containing protein